MDIKLSTIKLNHRYRGPAELDKHNLMVQQTNHDLTQLYNKIGQKEYNSSDGQANEIDTNIKRLVSWRHLGPEETDIIYANRNPATIIGNTETEKSYILIPINSLSPTTTNQEVIGLRNRLTSIEEDLDNIYLSL